MKQYFSRKIKILFSPPFFLNVLRFCNHFRKINIPKKTTGFVFLLVMFVIISIIVWQKYPLGVQRYKTITLGMLAAEKAGDGTGWAPPDNYVPEARLYVYALGDEAFCIGGSCGMGGYFTECLGGWISGYKDVGDVPDYGLRGVGVDIDKQKVITVADKEAKIVGIYPGARIRNLPYILRNHRDLVPKEVFEACSDSLPRWWK